MAPRSRTSCRVRRLHSHLSGTAAAAAAGSSVPTTATTFPVPVPTTPASSKVPEVEARLAAAEEVGVLKCAPVSLNLGAEVSGVDLKDPDLAPKTVRAIYDALLRYKVLVFRDANLSHEEHVVFTYKLADCSEAVGSCALGHTVFGYVDGHPELHSVYQGPSNKPRNMEGYKANVLKRPWTGYHSDITPCINPPAIGVLRGEVIPPFGGDTMFASLTAAYAGLSEPVKAFVQTLWGSHTYGNGEGGKGEHAQNLRAREMVTHHPMCQVHPDTGEKLLFVSPIFLTHLVGVKPRESEQIMDMLNEHAVRPEYTMRHRWRQGDIIIWDERCTLHCAPTDVYETGHDRQLFRTLLLGPVRQGADGHVSEAIKGGPMVTCEEELLAGFGDRAGWGMGNGFEGRAQKGPPQPFGSGSGLSKAEETEKKN